MAHENVLQTYNQCIKIFKMSYQRLLYALFQLDSGPPGAPDPDPDSPKIFEVKNSNDFDLGELLIQTSYY